MKEEALGFWNRGLKTMQSAEILLPTDPDSSASRAYYAAFYAVSALFALEGKTFSKHSALESAVHRDLVKSGRWPRERGEDYSALQGIRITGDYGVLEHVSARTAEEAIKAARCILRAVYKEHPEIFPYPGEN